MLMVQKMVPVVLFLSQLEPKYLEMWYKTKPLIKYIRKTQVAFEKRPKFEEYKVRSGLQEVL